MVGGACETKRGSGKGRGHSWFSSVSLAEEPVTPGTWDADAPRGPPLVFIPSLHFFLCCQSALQTLLTMHLQE